MKNMKGVLRGMEDRRETQSEETEERQYVQR